MALSFLLSRSSTPGKVPAAEELKEGQVFLNTHDGKAYFKKVVDNVSSVQEVGEGVTQMSVPYTVTTVSAETTIDPSKGEVYRLSAVDTPASVITFVDGVTGVSNTVTLFIVGQPNLTLRAIDLVDRMVGEEKVDGGHTMLGPNFTVFKFLWTGYEWIGYKDVAG